MVRYGPLHAGIRIVLEQFLISNQILDAKSIDIKPLAPCIYVVGKITGFGKFYWRYTDVF